MKLSKRNSVISAAAIALLAVSTAACSSYGGYGHRDYGRYGYGNSYGYGNTYRYDRNHDRGYITPGARGYQSYDYGRRH